MALRPALGLALGLALVSSMLAACSSGPAATAGGKRTIPAEVLARKAIAYSGYRPGQSPDEGTYPSPDQIKQDLDLVTRGGWSLLRLFDSGPHAERVLQVIADNHLDIEVVLGVWIAGDRAGHDAANQDQIQRCVALVEKYGAIVAAVSVGNETLDDWSNVKVAPAELADYIRQVRALVPQPVTTDDSWLPFMLGMDGQTSYKDVLEVARAVDFLSIHVYAFADAFYESWEWKQAAVPEAERARAMMDAALAYTKQSVRDVRDVMTAHGLDLPIVIGEVGWKSTAATGTEPEKMIEKYLAHPVNQRVFIDAVMRWVYGAERGADSPVAAFLFEAFDEPWKGEWGDDGWGLFDAARVPRYVLWDAMPDLRPANAPTYVEADAVSWKP